MKKTLSLLLVCVFALLAFAGCTQTETATSSVSETTVDTSVSAESGEESAAEQIEADDIIILYTNDVHCGIDTNLGYASLAAYKKAAESKTPYVTLVDCGDAVQGEVIGTVSQGEYPIEIMNQVGYDLAVLGNHEFDYGMERLSELIAESEATYIGANITYTGDGENLLADLKPYEIISYGETDVAFIGVTTPYSLTSSAPKYFMDENGTFVYDFTNESGEAFYACMQGYVDECREAGADYVVVCAHLGDTEIYAPFGSVDLIRNTTGVDVVLDGHEHSVIPCRVENNKDGEEVLLSSTGTKLKNIGQLTITAGGVLTTTLISKYDAKDEETESFIASVKATYEEEVNEVVAVSNVALRGYDENGIRMVRNRETNIGNFCADAYRYMTGAEISFVNGGGIRADIEIGDVTYADIISVHPFGNTLCMIEATGQEIMDALELACRYTQSEYTDGANAIGEDGSFQHVSGMKYTVDTSVESTVVTDENGMFVSVEGARRVCDVYVQNADGEYEPIDPERTYTLASHNYTLLDGGGGFSMLTDNNVLLEGSLSDYEVILNYFKALDGDLRAYESTEGRITVK